MESCVDDCDGEDCDSSATTDACFEKMKTLFRESGGDEAEIDGEHRRGAGGRVADLLKACKADG